MHLVVGAVDLVREHQGRREEERQAAFLLVLVVDDRCPVFFIRAPRAPAQSPPMRSSAGGPEVQAPEELGVQGHDDGGEAHQNRAHGGREQDPDRG